MMRNKKSFLGFLRYFFLGELYVVSEAEARRLSHTWDERIARADQPRVFWFGRRGFTHSDKSSAGSWFACSAAEVSDQAGPPPTDNEMCSLGVQFCKQVHMNDIAGARQTHAAIRERAAQLRKGQ